MKASGVEVSNSESFWQAYNYFCLKTPWSVQAEAQEATGAEDGAPVKIITSKPLVFILGCAKTDPETEIMVSKMIKAIGKSEDSVHCVWEAGQLRASSFVGLSTPQKVFVFGKQNIYGQTKKNHGDWFTVGKDGLQAMATFDLRDLKVNAKLKRQTWEHLKAFAGMTA